MLHQVWSLRDDYDGWMTPLAPLEDQSLRSALGALEYRHVDESEPNANAVVRLPSGRFLAIREYSESGREGAYNLSRLDRAVDPASLLAEFLTEAQIDESSIVWTEFDGRRRMSPWGT